MTGGLFITLYDEITLSLYLKYGLYGFLMKPVFAEQPSSQSRHFQALADYACSRAGTHVFFFLKRKIVYGGIISGNKDIASFYLNGNTSPIGRLAKSKIFWDESKRYRPTNKEGVFIVNTIEKAQPYILLFEKNEELSGKQISSDDLYFELGQYPFPLPSNSIQGMSFCTLTPGETETALDLFIKSQIRFPIQCNEELQIGTQKIIFNTSLLNFESFINEAHLEFTLLANLDSISTLIPKDEYVLCRQVPISPFKPFNMDRADICLYSITKKIKNGTIPNVIIELKKDVANYHAYNQIDRYLKWLNKITNNEEFLNITAILIAPDFNINLNKTILDYYDKIHLFSLNQNKLIHLK